MNMNLMKSALAGMGLVLATGLVACEKPAPADAAADAAAAAPAKPGTPSMQVDPAEVDKMVNDEATAGLEPKAVNPAPDDDGEDAEPGEQ